MADQPAIPTSIDAICIAVDSGHFVTNHRLGELYISTPAGRSPRLRVSRYYWDLESPVAVDFVRELRWSELEVAVKKTYCKNRGIRYILVRDAFDGEGAEAGLLQYQPQAEQVRAVKNAAKPLLGPRRQHKSTSQA